jgi:hypothetical protein
MTPVPAFRLKKSLAQICNRAGVCNSVELLFYILSRGREQMSPGETSLQDAKVLGNCKFLRPALKHVNGEREFNDLP